MFFRRPSLSSLVCLFLSLLSSRELSPDRQCNAWGHTLNIWWLLLPIIFVFHCLYTYQMKIMLMCTVWQNVTFYATLQIWKIIGLQLWNCSRNMNQCQAWCWKMWIWGTLIFALCTRPSSRTWRPTDPVGHNLTLRSTYWPMTMLTRCYNAQWSRCQLEVA